MSCTPLSQNFELYDRISQRNPNRIRKYIGLVGSGNEKKWRSKILRHTPFKCFVLSNFVVRCRVIEVFSVYRRFNLCINNYTYKKYLQNNLRNSVKPACEVATHNMIKHRDSIPLISVRVISCNSKSFSMLFFGITNSLSNINYYIFLLHIYLIELFSQMYPHECVCGKANNSQDDQGHEDQPGDQVKPARLGQVLKVAVQVPVTPCL